MHSVQPARSPTVAALLQMPPCVATIRDADEITLVSDALSALILCLLAAKRYGVEDFVPNNDAQISLDERKLALEARKIEGELEIRGQELQAKVAENSWLTKLASPLTTTVIAGVLTLAAHAYAVSSGKLDRARFPGSVFSS